MPIVFLQKNVAQSLSHHVGRPIDSGSSPTCILYADGGATMQASTSATKGPSTTLDSSAASGQTSVPLAATTNLIVGEEYGIGPNALGQSEIVTIDSITSGESISTRHDLLHTYASGNVFASRKLTLSVLAESISEARRNCRARWTYESSSQEYSEESIFNVSTYAPVCPITEADILLRYPDARNQTITGQPISELIVDVWENEVLGELAAVWSPEATISSAPLRLAAIHRVVAQLHYANEKLELFDKSMELFMSALERSISIAPKDEDDDGASDDELIHHPEVFRIVRS